MWIHSLGHLIVFKWGINFLKFDSIFSGAQNLIILSDYKRKEYKVSLQKNDLKLNSRLKNGFLQYRQKNQWKDKLGKNYDGMALCNKVLRLIKIGHKGNCKAGYWP
jgi:hypothetical protein